MAPRPRHYDHAQTASRAVVDAHGRRTLGRFVDAWHRCDIPALAAVLAADVVLATDPALLEFHGRDAVASFFATVPADGRLDTIDLVSPATDNPRWPPTCPPRSRHARGTRS